MHVVEKAKSIIDNNFEAVFNVVFEPREFHSDYRIKQVIRQYLNRKYLVKSAIKSTHRVTYQREIICTLQDETQFKFYLVRNDRKQPA